MELESLTESELFNCSFLFSFTFVSAFYSILSTPYQTSYLPNFQSSHFAEPPALTHPISPRWGFGFLLLLFSINISSLPGFTADPPSVRLLAEPSAGPPVRLAAEPSARLTAKPAAAYPFAANYLVFLQRILQLHTA